MGSGKKIHFIGIGGISMSGIASLLVDLGFEVSGSDLKDSLLLDELRDKGCKISIGHDPDNIQNPDEVVMTAAIPEDNVELVKARELDIPILKRAQVIARLMEYKKGIAIGGTHGKTTTTSMVSSMMEKANFDPTVLVGGRLNDIGGNAKLGKGDYLVTEADESDGSFLYFEPLISIVTNIEPDHMDYYGTEEKLKETFVEFMSNVPEHGAKIVCWDDDIIRSLVDPEDKNLITYGTRDDCMIKIDDIEFYPEYTQFSITIDGEKKGSVTINSPGMHNIYNSVATLCVGIYLELPFEEIADYLSQFEGVGRRFELKGVIDDIQIVDDYGHHPTEIKATLRAAQQKKANRVVCIFQPHRYSRTLHLKEDFSKAFGDADIILMTGIYSAGEKPIEGVSGRQLADMTSEYEKKRVEYFSTLEGIADKLAEIVEPGDLVITLGAGDVYQVGEELLSILEDSDLSVKTGSH